MPRRPAKTIGLRNSSGGDEPDMSSATTGERRARIHATLAFSFIGRRIP
jgi:hypothetical protein